MRSLTLKVASLAVLFLSLPALAQCDAVLEAAKERFFSFNQSSTRLEMKQKLCANRHQLDFNTQSIQVESGLNFLGLFGAENKTGVGNQSLKERLDAICAASDFGGAYDNLGITSEQTLVRESIGAWVNCIQMVQAGLKPVWNISNRKVVDLDLKVNAVASSFRGGKVFPQGAATCSVQGPTGKRMPLTDSMNVQLSTSDATSIHCERKCASVVAPGSPSTVCPEVTFSFFAAAQTLSLTLSRFEQPEPSLQGLSAIFAQISALRQKNAEVEKALADERAARQAAISELDGRKLQRGQVIKLRNKVGGRSGFKDECLENEADTPKFVRSNNCVDHGSQNWLVQ